MKDKRYLLTVTRQLDTLEYDTQEYVFKHEKSCNIMYNRLSKDEKVLNLEKEVIDY